MSVAVVSPPIRKFGAAHAFICPGRRASHGYVKNEQVLEANEL